MKKENVRGVEQNLYRKKNTRIAAVQHVKRVINKPNKIEQN